MRRHFPSDKGVRILEVACGSGAALAQILEGGYRDVTGVDRADEQVAIAREAGRDYVQHGDMFETLAGTAAASVDLVMGFDVIEHLTKDEVLTFLDEVHRVLRPGGRLIVHTVNAESPFFGRIRYGDFTHESAFTQGSLGQLMSMVGFARAEFHEDTPVVHGAASLARAAVWRVVRTGWDIALAAETGSPGRAIFSQNFLCVADKAS